MSQTHVLMASALLARPGKRVQNCAVLVGAIVPDLAIYTLLLWSKAASIPERKVWRELYWQEPWQSWTAAGNSIPIYVVTLLVGVVVARQFRSSFQLGVALIFFALAALIHIAGDLPVHVADAHRHLWPLSDWKFISPVSYWNPNHHGNVFALFEIGLGIVLTTILFIRFKDFWIRTLLALVLLAYIAVPLYFSYSLSG